MEEKKIDVIKIETGFDIPVSRDRYPLRLMKVGDSFAVAPEKRPTVSNTISRVRNDTDMEFITRLVDEDGVRKLRVWRTK